MASSGNYVIMTVADMNCYMAVDETASKTGQRYGKHIRMPSAFDTVVHLVGLLILTRSETGAAFPLEVEESHRLKSLRSHGEIIRVRGARDSPDVQKSMVHSQGRRDQTCAIFHSLASLYCTSQRGVKDKCKTKSNYM